MRKSYNNFQEIDNDIKILQLQKNIAVAKFQNRVQTMAVQVKEESDTSIWIRMAKLVQHVVFLRRNQIILLTTEFLLRRWLFRKKKEHKK